LLRSLAIRTNSSLNIWIGWSDLTRRNIRLMSNRSPINHIDRLAVPVIFFQGADDKIVPPNQTELMVTGLKQRGIPFGYFLFDGEQHGFRKGENMKRSLDAELYFYAAFLLRSGLRF
jgi:dipeptidyl aminopeptidase/acylaminoacyl peptidase